MWESREGGVYWEMEIDDGFCDPQYIDDEPWKSSLVPFLCFIYYKQINK
jgi:hypothetical protein